MKKRRGGVVLILLGVIIAGFVGYTVFNTTRRATPPKIETATVLVAVKEVPERTIVTPELLSLQTTLAEAVPPGALTAREQAVGKMTMTKILAGETIFGAKLADTGGKDGLSYTLPTGRVVVTLPASDIILTGAVRAGDHVDLLVTYTPKAPTGSTSQGTSAAQTAQTEAFLPATTQTTMQNLIVLGIGSFTILPVGSKDAKVNQDTANLVTFAVTHQDALIIKALKDAGDVRMELALRAAGDEQIATTEPVTLKSIIDRYNLTR
jgi:Flp pilus assembly protein CpaB